MTDEERARVLAQMNAQLPKPVHPGRIVSMVLGIVVVFILICWLISPVCAVRTAGFVLSGVAIGISIVLIARVV